MYNTEVSKAARRAFFITKPPMRITDYVRDTKGELKHVSWPTRRQALAYTGITIALSLILAVFLGVLDAAFARAIAFLIS